MILHFKRFLIGAADLLYRKLKRTHPGEPIHVLGHREPKRPAALAYGLLTLVGLLLLAALVLPFLVPAASDLLEPLGASGFLLVTAALCLASLGWLLFKLGRGSRTIVVRCYAHGLDIEQGRVIAAWTSTR